MLLNRDTGGPRTIIAEPAVASVTFDEHAPSRVTIHNHLSVQSGSAIGKPQHSFGGLDRHRRSAVPGTAGAPPIVDEAW
jgi:hypothetical protein